MTGVLLGVPVEPDAPEARDWLADELAKPPYQAARPTLFDTVAQAIRDWFVALFAGGDGTVPPIVPALIVLVALAALVAALLIFGRPRFNRRSSLGTTIFGAADGRTADALRRSAETAAANGDYTLAIEDLFRALARQLTERTVVTTTPGTTARDFARRAAIAFPAESARLEQSATVFDGVRYLDRAGLRDQYEQLAALELSLRTASPAVLETVGAPTAASVR